MKIFFVLLLMGFASVSHADIHCRGESLFGPISIRISHKTAEALVTGAALPTPNVFTDVAHIWDGHMTGLITAPGLALSYENHYGCFRNASVTTFTRGRGNIQKIDSLVCMNDQSRGSCDNLSFRCFAQSKQECESQPSCKWVGRAYPTCEPVE